jgi:hypothetical protein
MALSSPVGFVAYRRHWSKVHASGERVGACVNQFTADARGRLALNVRRAHARALARKAGAARLPARRVVALSTAAFRHVVTQVGQRA